MKATRKHLLTLVIIAGLLAGCGGKAIDLRGGALSDATGPSVSPAKLEAIGAHPGNKVSEKTTRKEITPAPKSAPVTAPPIQTVAVRPASTPLPLPTYKVQPGEALTTIAT